MKLSQKLDIYDCIIIGAGPAGLAAGTYLARFRMNVLIIDDNKSRASLISCSHNFPAFPNGIAGRDILSRMKKQYKTYGRPIMNAHVDKIIYDHKIKLFSVLGDSFTKRAKKIILATGVKDIEPSITNLKLGILKGLIRHCIICDGYEVIGKKIAIITDSKKGINEAMFLKTYAEDITMINIAKSFILTKKDRFKLKLSKINVISSKIDRVIKKNNLIIALKLGGQIYNFDSIYSALGCKVRSDLAVELGAKHKKSYLKVNNQQETTIKGLYAIGDVVEGLNQMSVAIGQGAIAATHIFKSLKNLE